MSTAEKLPDDFEELLGRFADRVATDEEISRFSRLLRDNAAARVCYLDYTDLESRLIFKHIPPPELHNTDVVAPAAASDSSALTPRPQSLLNWASRHPKGPAFAIAATVLIAALVVMGLTPVSQWLAGDGKNAEERQPAAPATSEFVAILNNSHKAKWLDGTRPRLKDPRLKVGRRLAIASGLIEVKYYTGAKVVIEGPAEFYVGPKDEGGRQKDEGSEGHPSSFILHPSNSGYLAFGKLVARVEGKKAQGFAIETPQATVVDWGTEFAVTVDEDSVVHAHVLEGKVQIQTTGESRLLAAGQTGAVNASGISIDSVEVSQLRERFAHLLLPKQLSRIVGVTVVASSEERNREANRPAKYLVDGSGLDGMRHTNAPNVTMWNVARGAKNPHLVFDLGKTYRLYEAGVWNYNGRDGAHLTRFVESADFWVSKTGVGTPATNPDDWQRVHDDYPLEPGTGKPGYRTPTSVPFSNVQARYVRMDDMRHDPQYVDPYGVHYGLSEVGFMGSLEPAESP